MQGRGIGSVTVSRVTDGAPERWPVVWRARLDDGATAATSLAIAASVPGYAVDADDLPLALHQTYAVTDAIDRHGVDILPSVLEFTVDSLQDGAMSALPAFDGDLDAWAGTNGPWCG